MKKKLQAITKACLLYSKRYFLQILNKPTSLLNITV